MAKLTESKCEACRADAPKVSEPELSRLQAEVPDWSVQQKEGVMQLQRIFRFSNFMGALDFTNSVAELAEREDHHPSLLTEWGRVEVTWWTHKIKGLHFNDFIMAAKTDQLYRSGADEPA